jgi:hypothetical protein
MLYLRSFNRFILISLALLGLSVSSQVQAAVINATDSGFWDDTGFSGDASFSNYIAGTWQYTPPVGAAYDVLSRNFFVFDLTILRDIANPVTSATLRIHAGNVKAGGNYSLWDVTSSIPTLRQPPNPLNPAVFADLGTGTTYGSKVLTTSDKFTNLEITLNSAALASINAVNANGKCTVAPSVECLWALGGNLAHDNRDEFAFGFSGNLARQLIYSTEPIPAVPVPAAIWLFGTALIGLVGFGKRRKAA